MRRNGKNDTDKCIMTAILYNTIEEGRCPPPFFPPLPSFPRVQNPIYFVVSKGCFYLLFLIDFRATSFLFLIYLEYLTECKYAKRTIWKKGFFISNWELANLTRCTLTIYSVLGPLHQTQKKIEFLLMMSLAIVCHMSPTIGIIYSVRRVGHCFLSPKGIG